MGWAEDLYLKVPTTGGSSCLPPGGWSSYWCGLLMTLGWFQVRAASLRRANTQMHLQLILSTNSLHYLSLVRPLRGSGMFEVLNFEFFKFLYFKKGRNTKEVLRNIF